MSTEEGELNYSIGMRIKEERDKKEISQAALSNILHTSRKTVVNWEGGTSAPDARQLSVMANECGFDIYYIVTGTRMPLIANQELAEYKSEAAQSLLEALSLADDEGRAALIAVAQLIKKNQVSI